MRARKLCKRLAAFLDGGEGRGPVDMRLTHSEQVEVRPVKDHQSHCGPFVERVPARVNGACSSARKPVDRHAHQRRQYRQQHDKLPIRKTPRTTDYAAASPAIMRTLSAWFRLMPRVSGAVRIITSDSKFHTTHRATTPHGEPVKLTIHTARAGIGAPAIRLAPVYASAEPE